MSCKPRVTPESLKNFLASLGGTALDVACNLKSRGIKGSRRAGLACPVYFAIAEEFEDGKTIHVSRTTASRSLFAVGYNGYLDVPLPKPVEEFVNNFDTGQYPELVKVDDGPKGC